MTNNITSSAQFAPPIGRFHEVDGRRIFVHRSGSGGPAVVLLPGASAVGLDYFGVQQQVSQFTTAVVYDRGGTGYSDPLPLPRSAAAVATELHELLHALNIAAPYVLAPHSLGGFYAHRFAQLYPQEVAGLVWLDALHRDVPVVALTVLGADPAQPERARQEMHDAKTRMDAALVSAVSHGKQRILSDTSHHRLCVDRPDAVVQAIRYVVDRAARP
ncbi:alpha/beta hydrolase [Nocardia sp. NBC_00881]|uniref:alpha/beta fold hydrolase n=1 Tax=Nocardia sp. NBC_00881 TaxID=2975995 RepID=UPI003866A474|nr:alpha/beta hydrolase [Nocardia sp. NBC_00881]